MSNLNGRATTNNLVDYESRTQNVMLNIEDVTPMLRTFGQLSRAVEASLSSFSTTLS
jgi:hypothetical protein